MGKRHFEVMLAEARRRDGHAVAAAINMRTSPGSRGMVSPLQASWWDDLPAWRVIDMARRLVDNDEELRLRFHDLTRRGRVHGRVPTLCVSKGDEPAKAAAAVLASTMHPPMFSVDDPDLLFADKGWELPELRELLKYE